MACVLLLFSFSGKAETYYVSNTGNDSNVGTSDSLAWKSLAKVNASIFKAGDQILFKRGDTFYGTLTITNSGLSGSPIRYGAYGTGEKPVISGFTTISGWTNEGGGIYSKAVASESSTNNIVTINGVNTAMGRWPNTGYMTYESHSGNTSVTDNELTNTPKWTGAELVLRENQWTLTRNLITNHTGTMISYTTSTSNSLTDGYGYFIQNDIKTLDAFGEWYYNGTKLYMYFGVDNPNDYTVKMSTLDRLLETGKDYTTHFNYITLDNLTLEGANLASVFLGQASTGWMIQNCNFTLNGKDCIYGYQLSYFTVDNNLFKNNNNTAIYTRWLGDNLTITNNAIDSIGFLPGMGGSDNNAYDGIVLTVRTSSESNSIVESNTIQHVGHSGIRMDGKGYTARYNLVTDFALVRSDAGGIYTFNANKITISKNVVLNGNKSLDGIGTGTSSVYPPINGIYIDNPCSNLAIIGNTIYNMSSSGIYIQGSQNIEVEANTIYSCDITQLWIRNRLSSYIISDLDVHDNVFVATKTPRSKKYPYSPLCVTFMTVVDMPSWGTFGNNYYVKPTDDNIIRIYYNRHGRWTSEGFTLAEWKSYSKQDGDSHKSPVTITNQNDLRFEYNATQSPKTITLSQPMTDIKGTKYTTSVTLQPFTSIVLIKD